MSSPQYGITDIGGPAKTIAWSAVLNRAYGLYAKNFWKYLCIAIPPALVIYFYNHLSRNIVRQLLNLDTFFPSPWKYMLKSTLVWWVNGAVYWIINAFFFAAISATFARMETIDVPAVTDAFTTPRRRFGSLILVALVTWTLFYVGRTLAGLALLQLNLAGLIRNYWVDYCATLLMLLLLAGLISKFALAIPELVHNLSSSAGSAMKKSLKETENWEMFFMMFLAKSAILGYGTYWIAGKGLTWVWQHWTMNPNGFSWVQWSVYIFIAAIVETPLFIAFSVLYTELQAEGGEA